MFGSILHPVQFRDIWTGTDGTPERRLAAAMLESAAVDLRQCRHTPHRAGQRLYWQTYEWIASPDREWPFSFVNLCEFLGLSAPAIRQQLLADRAGTDRWGNADAAA
jgi:hypothetical protein